MIFSDEHYVRIYTRDTKTWLLLGWEGQTVLMHLARKLDKAGVLDDVDDPVEDVALVTKLPLEVVAAGLPRLLKHEVFVQRGNRLVMVKYLEAQTASKSDALRAKDSRLRKRAMALSTSHSVTDRHEDNGEDPEDPEPASVTKRDTESRNVTCESQNVTKRHEADRPRHSTQSNAEQRKANKYSPPDDDWVPTDAELAPEAPPPSVTRRSEPPPAPSSPVEPQPTSAAPSAKRDPFRAPHHQEDAIRAFGLWREWAKQPMSQLNWERAKLIQDRLDAYGAESFELVLLGAGKDPWVQGHKDGEKHMRLEYLLGSPLPTKYEELLVAGSRLKAREQKARIVRKSEAVLRDEPPTDARELAEGVEQMRRALGIGGAS